MSEPPPSLSESFGGALQQARVEIEDVAGIGLAAWRTAEQQRDLAIAGGVLGEVVVDDQRVPAVVAEVLAHRGGGEGSEVLHRRGLGGGGGDDDGVGHRAVLFERLTTCATEERFWPMAQ